MQHIDENDINDYDMQHLMQVHVVKEEYEKKHMNSIIHDDHSNDDNSNEIKKASVNNENSFIFIMMSMILVMKTQN